MSEVVHIALILPMGGLGGTGTDWGVLSGTFGMFANGAFHTASALYHTAVSLGKFSADLNAVSAVMSSAAATPVGFKVEPHYETVEVVLDV